MSMATSVPWGDSTYGNTPQRGQVLREEYPCVVRSPNSMPFKAERRICCRPENYAEAPQENCVAVEKKKPAKINNHIRDFSAKQDTAWSYSLD